ncbi:MAG: hypothetical protein GY828_02495 [Candidatus Gracilibacteria bacterium]|nr:hypothetical protein [Candidatus Gracilibacteria bacterium]
MNKTQIIPLLMVGFSLSFSAIAEVRIGTVEIDGKLIKSSQHQGVQVLNAPQGSYTCINVPVPSSSRVIRSCQKFSGSTTKGPNIPMSIYEDDLWSIQSELEFSHNEESRDKK